MNNNTNDQPNMMNMYVWCLVRYRHMETGAMSFHPVIFQKIVKENEWFSKFQFRLHAAVSQSHQTHQICVCVFSVLTVTIMLIMITAENIITFVFRVWFFSTDFLSRFMYIYYELFLGQIFVNTHTHTHNEHILHSYIVSRLWKWVICV